VKIPGSTSKVGAQLSTICEELHLCPDGREVVINEGRLFFASHFHLRPKKVSQMDEKERSEMNTPTPRQLEWAKEEARKEEESKKNGLKRLFA